MEKITSKFKKNPAMYYPLSIAATWAGVGSLMNFKTLALESGMVPAITWAVFNCLACMFFGVICEKFPEMRRVFYTRPVKWFIGIMTFFQAWTQLAGIREIWADTPIGTVGGMVIAYASCIFFIILLYKRGTLRNVLTDWGSWISVYGILVIVTVLAMIMSKGQFVELHAGTENFVSVGLYKGILLMWGPFIYAYFYELIVYNEENVEHTRKVRMRNQFIGGGALFGVYMVFACALATVDFPPVLNVLKAILISLIAISSLSSCMFGGYVCFGNKLGLAANLFVCAFWYFVAPLGVMGIWTLMSELRMPFVIGMIIVAIVLHIKEKKKDEQISNDKKRLS